MATSQHLGINRKTAWLLLYMLFLSACSFSSNEDTGSAIQADRILPNPAIFTLQPSPTQESTPLPTLVLVPSEVTPAAKDASLDALPTAANDPLRFVFPTPGAAPISAWRPPLYPVPWAPMPYDHFYFSRPIAADEVNWPTQDYRYGGEFFADVVHTGVDIPAPKGAPVLAAGSGRVIWAGYGVYRGGYDTSDPYGLAVTIHHDFGYQDQDLFTVYGHLDRIDVVTGQMVGMGQQIGLVGETGRVTGPHLHFEVRLGENSFFATRNPELWIAPPQGWGVLAGRVMDSSSRLVTQQLVIITSVSSNQNWFARSYGPDSANSDPYYRENIVVGDLPAGVYHLRIAYAGVAFTQEIEIHPGLVSYFRFYGRDGFSLDPPAPPGEDFTPPGLDEPVP